MSAQVKAQSQRYASSFSSAAVFSTLRHAWSFTESDFSTFVMPTTIFGFLGGLASPTLSTNPVAVPLTTLILRVPLILLFNWTLILAFAISNQRLPESIDEDRTNKPGRRPIASGRLGAEAATQALLALVPGTLALGWVLGVWREAALVGLLTWMYNDLRGAATEVWRDAILAAAYGVFNHGSLAIAVGSREATATTAGIAISASGYAWLAIVSAVILTTMAVADLKDQRGDALHGRRTLPLWLGDLQARRVIAAGTLAWSVACSVFWLVAASGSTLLGVTAAIAVAVATAAPAAIGGYTAWRVLNCRDHIADKKTWKVWCVWITALYTLPVMRLV